MFVCPQFSVKLRPPVSQSVRPSVHLFVFSFWSLSFCEESLCFCCCDFFVICYDMGVLQSLLFWCSLPFSLLFVVVVLFLFLNFLLLSGPDLTGKRVCLFLYLRAICPFLYINYKHASNPSTCPSVRLSVYWPNPHISFDSFIFKFGARHDQEKKITKEIDHHWEMLFGEIRIWKDFTKP